MATGALPVTPESLPDYMAQLESLVHSQEKLEEKGFLLQPLTEEALDKVLRCLKCNKREYLPRQLGLCTLPNARGLTHSLGPSLHRKRVQGHRKAPSQASLSMAPWGDSSEGPCKSSPLRLENSKSHRAYNGIHVIEMELLRPPAFRTGLSVRRLPQNAQCRRGRRTLPDAHHTPNTNQ